MDAPTRDPLLDQPLDSPAALRVQMVRVTMPAGMASGPHVHNGPVFGVIEAGSAVLRIAGSSRILTAGDAFHEPGEVVVDGFDALEDGVRFTVTYLTAPGVEPAITTADVPSDQAPSAS